MQRGFPYHDAAAAPTSVARTRSRPSFIGHPLFHSSLVALFTELYADDWWKSSPHTFPQCKSLFLPRVDWRASVNTGRRLHHSHFNRKALIFSLCSSQMTCRRAQLSPIVFPTGNFNCILEQVSIQQLPRSRGFDDESSALRRDQLTIAALLMESLVHKYLGDVVFQLLSSDSTS